jgi:FlaA1/EpsC-like NDP-sugar epimerase
VASARTLLVGAGFTGRVIAQEYARGGRLSQIVGFVDDAPALHGTTVEGIAVLGGVERLAAMVQASGATEVVVTIPSLTGDRLRAIVEQCAAVGVPVRTMPAILEFLGEPLTSQLVRPVLVADLLRRAHVDCHQPPEAYLSDASILITGAGGSIGSELARQVARATPRRLVLLGHGENSIHDIATQLRLSHPQLDVQPVVADIRDEVAISATFQRERPRVVFHAAAHKHVPLMETQPDEAVRNNVLGTRVVVEAARAAAVPRLVFISTDKAVRPIGVMGATKCIGEWIVTDAGLRHGWAYATVRFGNVLGSRGSLVPLLERQLARGGPLTITDPGMTRFFMTIPEAVFLVLQAGGLATPGDLFVLDMGEPIRIVDLARDLVRLSGLSPDDIPLSFTGLRPGEKQTEELWVPGSIVERATEQVLRVREPVEPLRGEALLALTTQLIEDAQAGRSDAVAAALRAQVMGITGAVHSAGGSQ